MFALAATTTLIAMNSACNMPQQQQQQQQMQRLQQMQQLQMLQQRQYKQQLQQQRKTQEPKANPKQSDATVNAHKKWYKKCFKRQKTTDPQEIPEHN
ncbi:putative GATA zinc finger domain-containing protein 25 [Drosophila montana]|uniref:putative GATA zinc finger domain-containing protein 25 n=1 Tax=Drosophila montana TaxID=40370 RepID=UPI00313AECB1